MCELCVNCCVELLATLCQRRAFLRRMREPTQSVCSESSACTLHCPWGLEKPETHSHPTCLYVNKLSSAYTDSDSLTLRLLWLLLLWLFALGDGWDVQCKRVLIDRMSSFYLIRLSCSHSRINYRNMWRDVKVIKWRLLCDMSQWSICFANTLNWLSIVS